MTREELTKKFEDLKFDINTYTFEYDVSLDDCHCMTESDEGWEVYYIERGVKSSTAYFDYEFQACDYLFGTLLRRYKEQVLIKRID